ncbi:MAG: apolipoprotein N-acyltransferase [Bacteroidales bacterium]|nr:apolipoprotein N-acyltransferase [Bacteroidales bacterium]
MKAKKLILALLSGLLLWLSWNPNGLPFLIFFSFVPLLVISDLLIGEGHKHSSGRAFCYSLIAFLIWNTGTTWWIFNSTGPGAIVTFILNSSFMALVIAVWHFCRRKGMPGWLQPIALISFWMSFEYLHLNWDLTWPWLNLGNVFDSCTQYVQWYEYTGTFGGTLWVLAANLLIYYTIRFFNSKRKMAIAFGSVFVLWIALPVISSVLIYHHYKNNLRHDNPVEAIIVQHNTEAYEEQFRMSNIEHTLRILDVAMPLVTDSTQLIVTAESSISHTISANALLDRSYPADTYLYYGFTVLDSVIAHYPNLNFILGLSTFETFTEEPNIVYMKREDGLYQSVHNSATCYNKYGVTDLYHKSRLVPGVEKMPFPKLFFFLEDLVIDLGGPRTSLSPDTAQHAFQTTINNGTVKVGTVICYESAYGEIFSGFVKDGAQLMAVITNDAWWGDTPGYKQHFLFSRLRAVESRRTILRSSNPGISAFIDESGDVHQATKYDTRLAIKQTVYPNDYITFYTHHGDYLARIAVVFAAICLLWSLLLWGIRILTRNKKQQIN